MREVIYRDEAIKKVAADFGPGYNWDSLRDFAVNALKKIPAVKAREDTRGEWIDAENFNRRKCSNCGIYAILDYAGEEILSPFCPYCGSDMRKENLRG